MVYFGRTGKSFCVFPLSAHVSNAFKEQECKAVLTINYHENKKQREFTLDAIKELKRTKIKETFHHFDVRKCI